MKVLVIGATGKFAHLVVRELLNRGARIRALVRSEDKVAAARRLGAQGITIGDLRNRESLRQAAGATDAVFHIGPAFAPDETEMGLAIVEAAKGSRRPEIRLLWRDPSFDKSVDESRGETSG
jgi:uncharacterized protein YbjT (DUF2867 family)